MQGSILSDSEGFSRDSITSARPTAAEYLNSYVYTTDRVLATPTSTMKTGSMTTLYDSRNVAINIWKWLHRATNELSSSFLHHDEQ